MSSVPQQSPLSPSLPFHRPRASTTLAQTMMPPACSFSTPQAPEYRSFTFGVEFEMILRPRANMFPTDELLPDDLPLDYTSRLELRRYSLFIQHLVANKLRGHGMPCDDFEPDSEAAPNYTKWNVMLDASVSKEYTSAERFCSYCQSLLSIHSYSSTCALTIRLIPLGVVSPKIIADHSWVQFMDDFWSVILRHFELRRDTSCGYHIHISTVKGGYSLDQLRMMAKAVIF